MAVQANTDIRAYLIVKGVKIWELARQLGYSHENSLSRALRNELPTETKDRFMRAIDEVADGRGV